MRSRYRSALGVLLAMFALGALASASASAALPEFEGFFPTTYHFTSSTEVRLSEESNVVFCTGGLTAEGSITAAKTMSAKFVIKGCEISSTHAKCTSSGAAAGEIKTGVLPASLVYTSKVNHEAAIVFNPYEPGLIFPPPPIPTFATFTCGSGPAGGMRNGVIVPVTPINTSTTNFTLNFKVVANKQVPQEFENAAGETVHNHPEVNFFGTSYFEGALGTSGTLATAKTIKIKA